jgi:hypothetical protein
MNDPRGYIEKNLSRFQDANGIKITFHADTLAQVEEQKAVADRFSMEEFLEGKAGKLNFAFGHGNSIHSGAQYSVCYYIKPYKQ